MHSHANASVIHDLISTLDRIASYMVMTISIIWSIYAALGTWALCSPIAFNWNPMIPGGHCADRQASFYAIGVLDVATDCLIFLLPIPMIWNLQTALRNKIGLSLIFSIGVVYVDLSLQCTSPRCCMCMIADTLYLTDPSPSAGSEPNQPSQYPSQTSPTPAP